MKQKLLLLIAVLFVVGGFFLARNFSTGLAQQPATRIFEPIVAVLESKTQVPLKLPTYIPGENSLDKPFWANITQADSEHYLVTIGFTKDCEGGNYCRYGTVAGEKILPSTPTAQQSYEELISQPDYKPLKQSPEKAATVKLAKDIEGYFVPYLCGANCDDAKVFWDEDTYRYLVGVKMGSKDELIQMANSAISQ